MKKRVKQNVKKGVINPLFEFDDIEISPIRQAIKEGKIKIIKPVKKRKIIKDKKIKKKKVLKKIKRVKPRKYKGNFKRGSIKVGKVYFSEYIYGQSVVNSIENAFKIGNKVAVLIKDKIREVKDIGLFVNFWFSLYEKFLKFAVKYVNSPEFTVNITIAKGYNIYNFNDYETGIYTDNPEYFKDLKDFNNYLNNKLKEL